MVHAGRPTGHPSRQLSAALLAAAIVAAGGLWAIGSAPAGSFYDDGIYLTLGRSLATGTGLHYLNLPGTPAATHYPPGYPALLAICWWLGAELPRVLFLAKLLNAVFMATAAGMLTWILAEGGAPPLVAAIGTIAGSIAVPVLALSTIPFSEPFFLVQLLLATLMTRRALRQDSTDRTFLLAGLNWGVLALVRTRSCCGEPRGGGQPPSRCSGPWRSSSPGSSGAGVMRRICRRSCRGATAPTPAGT